MIDPEKVLVDYEPIGEDPSPWWWLHAEPRVVRNRRHRSGEQKLVIAVVLSILGAAFIAGAYWGQERLPWAAYVSYFLFLPLAFSFWFAAIYARLHRWKYADAGVVTLDHAPLPQATEIELHFHLPRALREGCEMRFTLRCIREHRSKHESESDDGITQVSYTFQCFERYSDERKVRARRERTVSPRFTIPTGLPGNQRNFQGEPYPITYWELEIIADVPGIDYSGLFLLPVE